ncbi:MAG: PilN domain-containing protein [Desulfobacteraceae bacterium]|nr:PilN domain-containing protein [Desulfobacteraceae bacterium]
MAVPFLRLELDNFGIKAKIIEQSYKQTLIKDDCYVLYEELPQSEENPDLFDTGMDLVIQHLDLEACSTAIIFVSTSLISFRNIDLPFSSQKKVKQVLPFELETLLPGTNQTYISDFHMLDMPEEPSESNLILSASIDESCVEHYFSKLGTLGIKPLIITPIGYAAAVLFLKERKDISTFAFLHISECEITLVLVNNRKPCVVRTFSSLDTSPDTLAIWVKQTMIGFNQRTGANLSFDIFVSADEESQDAGHIYSALEKTLEYQAGLRSVEQGIQKALIQEKINSTALLLSISPDKTVKYLFNFCKGKYGTSSFFKTYFSNIAASVVLFLCMLSFSLMSVGVDNSKLEQKIAVIDKKAVSIFKTTFPDIKKVKDAYQEMKANVKHVLKKSGANGNTGKSVKNSGFKQVQILSKLSQTIEASTDIEISRFLFNSDRLVISGSTDNFNNVDPIKSKIESSPIFKKVSISSAAADKKGERVNFKFIIEM